MKWKLGLDRGGDFKHIIHTCSRYPPYTGTIVPFKGPVANPKSQSHPRPSLKVSWRLLQSPRIGCVVACTCVHIYICVYLYIMYLIYCIYYMYIDTSTCIHLHVCTYVNMHLHMHADWPMFACMPMCIGPSRCVWIGSGSEPSRKVPEVVIAFNPKP